MQVECSFFDYENNKFNQYEFDIDLNMYPCCYIYIDKLNSKINDPVIDHIDTSLKTNKLENIVKEFDKVLNTDVWSSKKCPKICIEYCGKK